MLTTVTLVAMFAPEIVSVPVGLTGSRKPIEALISPDDLDYGTRKVRVLVVGGIDGSMETARVVREAVAGLRRTSRFAVSAIPLLILTNGGKG